MSELSRRPITPVLLCAAAVALIYLTVTTGRYFVHNYEQRQAAARLRSDLQQLDRQHDELIAVRDRVKSDAYVEEQARRVLGLVHPGQTLVIVSPADDAPPPQTTPVARPTPAAWWERLFPPEPSTTPSP